MEEYEPFRLYLSRALIEKMRDYQDEIPELNYYLTIAVELQSLPLLEEKETE